MKKVKKLSLFSAFVIFIITAVFLLVINDVIGNYEKEIEYVEVVKRIEVEQSFRELTFEEIEKALINKATELNKIRVLNDKNVKEFATIEQINNRVYYLGYYAKKIGKYDWQEMWLDSFAIVWRESYFVNYKEHDNGRGFGWIAMLKTTADEIMERNGIEEDPLNNDKLQAFLLISYLNWSYTYYNDNSEMAVTGYNEGTNVSPTLYMYSDYYLGVQGRLRELYKLLRDEYGYIEI